MTSDLTFCKCVEDKLENCEDFKQSFEKCVQDFETIKKLLNCDEFLKFINNMLISEECISYHHYLIYYMAPRCISLSEDLKKIIESVKNVIENYSTDVNNILKVVDKIYDIYVRKVIESIFKKDPKLCIEIALICDILTRLQLYTDCLLRSRAESCKSILCSLKARIYALF
ncbi:MAG: hypothetical protein GXO26_01355 [Crenarchaeota archaeon]|nr:hypothetical protein [Thermoproteota archaeon]